MITASSITYSLESLSIDPVSYSINVNVQYYWYLLYTYESVYMYCTVTYEYTVHSVRTNYT